MSKSTFSGTMYGHRLLGYTGLGPGLTGAYDDEGCAAFPADCSGPEDTGIMASICDIARLLREVPHA